MTQTAHAETARAHHHDTESASEAAQKVAALKSQLAMIQAERSLLNARMELPQSVPPAAHRHGIGGWIFCAASFAFLVAMIVFAVSQPPVVRIVEVPAPAPAVEVAAADPTPAAVEPAAEQDPAEPTPEEPTATRSGTRRTGRRTTGQRSTSTNTAAMGTLGEFSRDPIGGAGVLR